jgi:transcriptional regulator ATRX
VVTPETEFDLLLSGKMVVFEQILRQCQEKGDKLIVFSQSLMSLDLIEKFLAHFAQSGQRWKKDEDYFRLDGSIDVTKRSKDCTAFNDASSPSARLYLISTRAGGIGINLVGANRCIIFDASWNPSYDTQSIFRIYRFGQVKGIYFFAGIHYFYKHTILVIGVEKNFLSAQYFS